MRTDEPPEEAIENYNLWIELALATGSARAGIAPPATDL